MTLPPHDCNPSVSVLLTAEGTYPHHFGGVSTWCQAVIECLPDVRFHVLAITDRPGRELRFALPANVAGLDVRVAWGLPYLDRRPGWHALVASPAAEQDALHVEFLPAWRTFLTNVFGRELDAMACADAVGVMHRHFVRYGYERTMRSVEVWQVGHAELTLLLAEMGPSFGLGYVEPTLADVTTVMTWLRHWLAVIGEPLPATDVVHAAMAGLCTLVGVAAHRAHGARFLLTEHGVYLREVYLAEAAQPSGLLKLVRVRWARRMTELAYAVAEQISPCCDFNQRWETRNGADPAKLRTIYYGIDPARFTPEERAVDGPPVVVWAGRINPLKDVETLLRAAAIVCAERDDATFLLFGSAGEEDRDYEARCRALWRELHLEDRVLFRGFTDRVDLAFGEGDVVVLPSISEGFPNVTLEAMLCGRPVVVTAVGGLPEQIGAAGLAVEPRNPVELADGILALLADHEARRRLGRVARERASSRFTVGLLRDEHLTTYRRLVDGHGAVPRLGAADDVVHRLRAVRAGTADAPVRTLVDVDTSGGEERHSAAVAERARRQADDAASTLLGTVVDEVAAQTAEPVDALEVTAVLESLGLNDDLAREVHGVDDVFALGELVLLELRVRSWGREWWREPRPVHHGELRLPRFQGLAALAASLLVLLTVQLARVFGGWDSTDTMGFVVGVSAGMACANGLVLAAARPISFYLANRDRPLAHEMLRRSRAAAGAVVAAVAVALVVGFHVVAAARAGVVAIALFGFFALVLAWVPLGITSMLGLGHRAAWPVLVGTATFVAVDRALAPFVSWHLAQAALAGVGVTLAGFTWVLSRALPDGAHRHSRSIPRPVLTRGTTGYLVFGLVATAPLLVPHAITWAFPSGETYAWHRQMTAVEFGLTLALVPALAGIGTADAALRRFWVTLSVALGTTPAAWPERLRERLNDRRRARLLEYLGRLVGTTAAFAVLVAAAAVTGLLDGIAGRAHRTLFLWSFGAALVGYVLYGWASFTTMHAVSLGRPRAGVQAVVAAVAVAAAAGIPLAALWDAWAAGPIVVIACASYALAASFTVDRAFVHANQLYASIS